MPDPTAFSNSQLQASAAEALDAIAAVGDRAGQLVQAWVTAANAPAVQEVAQRGAGDARKAARRGLNVLKSKGVAIPPRLRAEATSRKLSNVEAWLLAPDPNGTVVVVLAARQPDMGYNAVFVFLQDGIGVLKVQSGVMSQSKLQLNMKNVLANQGYEAVAVPLQWARALVEQARQAQRAAKRVEPLGFKAAEDLLLPVAAEVPPHPFDEEGLALSEEDALKLAEKSATLHTLPEFRSWVPSKDAVAELLAKVGARLQPGQQPSEAELSAHVREESLAATDRYFTPERRSRLVRNLKHSALSVVAREGEAKGLEVAAIIAAIEQSGLITNPPRQIPFLTAYFDKAIAILLAQGGGKLRVPIPRQPALAPVAAEDPASAPAEGTATPDAGPPEAPADSEAT